MICANIKPAVSGLGEEFTGVKGINIDATSSEGTAAIRDLGFQSHGIVIRDGAHKPLWKQADHDVNMDDVRAALKELTQE